MERVARGRPAGSRNRRPGRPRVNREIPEGQVKNRNSNKNKIYIKKRQSLSENWSKLLSEISILVKNRNFRQISKISPKIEC